MGAKPATVSGLSGLGDIMLTCYGSLSRNRCASTGLVVSCLGNIMLTCYGSLSRNRCVSFGFVVCLACTWSCLLRRPAVTLARARKWRSFDWSYGNSSWQRSSHVRRQLAPRAADQRKQTS